VFFEIPDCAFRGIAAMTVRRDHLIIDVIGGEKMFNVVDAMLSRV
jgi:hypothetical protein